jgi:hypothetical protein
MTRFLAIGGQTPEGEADVAALLPHLHAPD